jgi:hypothetical protein
MSRHPLPDAETVAKSFALLQHGEHLTPAERGSLMLGLSQTADSVFKADRVADHLGKCERAIALIDQARAEKHGAEVDELFDKVKAAVKRGECEPGDLIALETRLHEIKRSLQEKADGDKN